MVIMQITPEYLAGFIDGEGNMRLHSGFSKQSPTSLRAEVAITNTNQQILKLIQSGYGGHILKRPNGLCPIYRLYWSSLNNIKLLLDVVTPHLIIKRQHAELLLEYLTRHNSQSRSRITKRDREIVHLITQLNKELRHTV